MSNPFAKSERVRRQAARWFARLQGPVTERDQRAFAHWRASDPDHEAAYQRMAGHWRAAAAVRPAMVPSPLPTRGTSAPLRLALVAASALIVVAGGIGLVGIAPPFVAAGRAEDRTVVTKAGEIRAVTLSDGTRLTLDTRSAATVRFDARQRLIRIDRGRARVAWAGEERPLSIEAGKPVDVGGTGVLDVSRDPEQAVFRAVEGPVTVSMADRREEIGQGQALRIPLDGSTGLSRTMVADPDWPLGVLVFQDEPLGSVIARANRYATAPILLDDPGLSRERITGRYKAGDTAGLAASLAAAFRLHLSRSPEGAYRLARRAERGA